MFQIIFSPHLTNNASNNYYDIAVFNVNAFSGQEEELEEFLSGLNMDLLVMLEKRAENIKGLDRVVDDFSSDRSIR